MTESRIRIEGAKLLLLLFGVVFGGHQIVSGTSAIVECFEAESWPTTEALVTSSEVIKCGRSEYGRCPTVRYKYQVQGRVFTGTRITLAPHSSGSATEALKGLDLNSKVQVRYSPSDPNISVLRLEGQYLWNWSSVGVGLYLLFEVVSGFRRRGMLSGTPSDDLTQRDHERRRNADIAMEKEIHERLRNKSL